MKNQYTYVDYAPLFVSRQRILGSVGQLLHGNPAKQLCVIGVLGSRGKTQLLQLLTRLAQKWHRTLAVLSSEEAVIIFQGVVVYRKSIKHTDDLSGLFIHGFLKKAKKNGIKDVFLETNAFQLLHHTFTGVEFDGGLITYGSLQEVPRPQEEEWYLIAKEFFFDRMPYFQRKDGIEKTLLLNRDDFFYTELDGVVADKIQTYGVSPRATLSVSKWKKDGPIATAELKVPNATLPLRTNRSDVFSLYSIAGALLYLLGEGALNERVTKDIAFPVPASPFGDMLHVSGVELQDSVELIEEYFSPKSTKRFLIVLRNKLTPHDLFALQSFLKAGGTVLLWQQRKSVSKSLAQLLVDMSQEYPRLLMFTRAQELVLEAKLLVQTGEGVILSESDQMLELFHARSQNKDW